MAKTPIEPNEWVATGKTSPSATYTSIKYLNLDEKIYEIASLISGGKVSEKQLEYAKELVLNK